MRIIISASGIGGHIFPGLSLASKLKQRGYEVIFFAERNDATLTIAKNNFTVEKIYAAKINFGSLKSILNALIILPKAFFQAVYLLKKIKPNAVVSFGGYATFVTSLAAGILGIPLIIHEQNVIAGRANRLSAKFARKVAISFPETKKYFNSKKVVVTGCPVREELFQVKKEDALRQLNLSKEKFTILVMGGSLGSRRINESFIEALSGIKDLAGFQVIHLTGRNDFDFVNEAYKKIEFPAYRVAFLEEMGYAYSMADLVISRAGASSLSEIMSFGIPSVLVPYPFAYSHQNANALSLEGKGVSVVIEDQDLDGFKLKQVILQFLNDPDRLKNIKENFNKIFISNGAVELAKLVASFDKNA